MDRVLIFFGHTTVGEFYTTRIGMEELSGLSLFIERKLEYDLYTNIPVSLVLAISTTNTTLHAYLLAFN
jgi:hypothetical protein